VDERDDHYRVMDLKALRCFWAVGRRGGLTQAGIDLGISEPAISQRVKALERYLGTKLYEARGGRITFSATGRRTLLMASELFERLEEFERALGGEEATGELDIAAYDLAELYILPQIVGRFRAEFPRVRVRQRDHSPATTVDFVRRNEVDLGVIPQRPLPDELVFHPWRTYPSHLLIPLGHPLLRHGRPALADLLRPEIVARYPLVVPEKTDEGYARLHQALASLGLAMNVLTEVGSMEAVKRYALLGLGLGVVSGLCLTAEDQARVAVIDIPAEYAGDTTYGVVLRRDKYRTAPLAGLLRLFGAA
jgi:DNA-binding transcriptional LysR family regulator